MVDHDALMKTARSALRAAATIAEATAEVRRAHPDAPEWLVDQSIQILLGGDLVDPNPPTPGSLRAKFRHELEG